MLLAAQPGLVLHSTFFDTALEFHALSFKLIHSTSEEETKHYEPNKVLRVHKHTHAACVSLSNSSASMTPAKCVSAEKLLLLPKRLTAVRVTSFEPQYQLALVLFFGKSLLEPFGLMKHVRC